MFKFAANLISQKKYEIAFYVASTVIGAILNKRR